MKAYSIDLREKIVAAHIQQKISIRKVATIFSVSKSLGYGRYHYLDRLRFMYIARGSLAETKSAFIIAEKIGFCTTEQLAWVNQIEAQIEKGLNGYCRFIRSQKQGGEEYGKQYIREPVTKDYKLVFYHHFYTKKRGFINLQFFVGWVKRQRNPTLDYIN